MIRSFRDLDVWQRGMYLVEAAYRLTVGFPKSEIYGITGQIRRAAVSIPSNIAEGHARASTKEYLNHLSIAQASLAELETQVEIAFRLQYVSQDEVAPLLSEADKLGRQLRALRSALAKR
jgi:four helix bundle protein